MRTRTEYEDDADDDDNNDILNALAHDMQPLTLGHEPFSNVVKR